MVFPAVMWTAYEMCVGDWSSDVCSSDLARRNINNLKYRDDTTLMAENKEELKSLLMKVKEESEKTKIRQLKNNKKIKPQWNKTKKKKKLRSWYPVPSFMANRWGKCGNSDRIHFLGLQNNYRQWLHHEIKRRLLLGRKAVTNLDSILKSRDIILPTKVK